MSWSAMFQFGCVASSLILTAPDTFIRPLSSLTSVKRPLKPISLTHILLHHKTDGLVYFFTPTPTWSGEISIANATHLLESATNGSDRHELLLFLEYLSEIHWFGVYHGGWVQRQLTNGIIHWVCTTLVGSFLLPRTLTSH
jgi:hypothetical protein